MATLTEIARARKRALRELRPGISETVRDAKRLESAMKRVINRRQAIPSDADLAKLLSLFREVDRDVANNERSFERVATVFAI